MKGPIASAVGLLAVLSGGVCAGRAAELACGDRISGHVRLDRDLEGCGRTGLRLSSNAVLDCDGHAIRGRGPADSSYGVRLDRISGAEVRGCRISGFKRGVLIRGGQENRVLRNVLEDNVYGVGVAGATKAGTSEGHLIAGNHITRSVMDGIHLGTGTARTTLVENVIRESGQEGLYFQWCDRCAALGNSVEGSGEAALYVKHSSHGTFRDNVVRGSLVQVRGESTHNVFARNELLGSSFVFDGYVGRDEGRDPSWLGIPHDNEIVGGAVVGRKVCFRFGGAYANRIDDVLVADCRPMAERPFGEFAARDNAVAVRRSSGDLDGDRIADAEDTCTDADGDGFGDQGFAASSCSRDSCPDAWNPDQADADADGWGDACDACPLVADPEQRDHDGDGRSDACDFCVDADGDGLGSAEGICPPDNCPETANANQLDRDLDGRGDECDPCPSHFDTQQRESGGCMPDALPELTAAERSRFLDGFAAFTRVAEASDGLGPVFNGESCAECHEHPAIGGTSLRTVTLFGVDGPDGFDPMSAHGGPLLQSQGIRTGTCSATGEAVPRGATVRRRLTPPLFGAGLIDAISEDAILANADPDDQDGDGISGRANRIKGRVGRFGWKAHEARLEDFAARAMLEEMGVTTPLLPEETSLPGRGAECDATPDPEDDGAELAALTGFLRLLAPLEARASELADRRGAELFRASGCPGCHVGELPGPSGNAPGNGTPVRLFSDLLLHDMGPSLADGIVQGDASGREFRTAPLWGVAQRKAYLHDGRAPTLNAAIALHDGEAKGARERFLALGMEERQALIAYLETL